MNKDRKNYIKSCEVSEVTTLNLGGSLQKIAVEGKSKSLPVVIALHGGPGTPAPFSVGCRGLFPQLTDSAVMVYWDQLGCGINNCKLGNGVTIENFVQMTCDLVKEIRTRFPQNKVYLLGISWGSVLALKTAVRIPELLNGALVFGQIVSDLFFNEEVSAAFDSAPLKISSKARKFIAVGAGADPKTLKKSLAGLTKLIKKYTDGYDNKNSRPAEIKGVIKGLLSSPDYKFKDFAAIVKNGYLKNDSLWGELIKINLSGCFAEVKIPYRILQGDTDLAALTSAAVKAVNNSQNPLVSVRVLKNSGHLPSEEAMQIMFEELRELIK